MRGPFGRGRGGPPIALGGGVFVRPQGWSRLLVLAVFATAACTRVQATVDGGRNERHAYLEDAAFRRGALVVLAGIVVLVLALRKRRARDRRDGPWTSR